MALERQKGNPWAPFKDGQHLEYVLSRTVFCQSRKTSFHHIAMSRFEEACTESHAT